MNIIYKKGISLIVLVITIIIMIILAGVVILGMTENNPIEDARKGVFIHDLQEFIDELKVYKMDKYSNNKGKIPQFNNIDDLVAYVEISADGTTQTISSQAGMETVIKNFNYQKYGAYVEIISRDKTDAAGYSEDYYLVVKESFVERAKVNDTDARKKLQWINDFLPELIENSDLAAEVETILNS